MAKHRVSEEEKRETGEKSRYSPLAVRNKGTCVPTGALPSESVGEHTMESSNFHILLESNNVTTRRRRGNPMARRNHDRSQQQSATRAQILSHPRCTIYQRERAKPRPRRPARSARFDRGNNDRMERTMGAQGAGWKRYCLAPSRGKSTFDSIVTLDPRAPPRCTEHQNRYTTIPRFTSTKRAFSDRRIRDANYTRWICRGIKVNVPVAEHVPISG